MLKYKIRIKLFVLHLREQEVFVCCVRRIAIAIESLLALVDMDNDNRFTVVSLRNKLCLCNILCSELQSFGCFWFFYRHTKFLP